MQVKIIKVGSLETNCYILIKGKNCLIIDPGDEKEKIKKQIGELKPLAIIITHYHFDHIKAIDLKDDYQIPIYDYKNLEKEYKIDNFNFEIIYTKGHHNTCVTFYFKEYKMMFVGDFIFKGSIGRIDLEGASKEDMIESINKIKEYSDDITIYPGHDEITTLGYEKKYNHYVEYFK